MVRKSAVVSSTPAAVSSTLVDDIAAASLVAQFDAPTESVTAPVEPAEPVAVTSSAVFTIGVIGHTPNSFLTALRDTGCQLVLDVRFGVTMFDRRYSFANADSSNGYQLQHLLQFLGVGYLHSPRLSLTKEMDVLRKADEAKTRVNGQNRDQLGSLLSAAYERHCQNYDWSRLVAKFAELGVTRVAVLDYNRYSTGSIRSIVAQHLGAALGANIFDIEGQSPVAKEDSGY